MDVGLAARRRPALVDNAQAETGKVKDNAKGFQALKAVNAGKVHTVVGPKDPAGAG